MPSGLSLAVGLRAIKGHEPNRIGRPEDLLQVGAQVLAIVKDRIILHEQESIGFRIEGVPRYDLIGDSHGWRRPGYESYVEPGFLFTHGRSTWSIYVPRALVRNRRPNPYTGNAGDATFPDYVVIMGYSYRFGGAAPAPSRTAPEPSEPRMPGGPPAAASPDVS